MFPLTRFKGVEEVLWVCDRSSSERLQIEIMVLVLLETVTRTW